MSNNTLSILIPAYNEAQRLPKTLTQLIEAIEVNKLSPFTLQEVIVIDDGSHDQTIASALHFKTLLTQKKTHLTVVSLQKNQGKGAAIHAGIQIAQSQWSLVADADGSTPWDQTQKLGQILLNEDLDIAMGSRGLIESDIRIHQSWIREHMGKTFNLLVRLLTGLPFKDTQCGFKLFKTQPVQKFLPLLKINRFAWDVEFLLYAQNAGLRIREIPVTWEHQEASRVNPLNDSLEMLWSILKTKIRLIHQNSIEVHNEN